MNATLFAQTWHKVKPENKVVKVCWVLSPIHIGIFPLYPSNVKQNIIEYKQEIARMLWYRLNIEFSEAVPQWTLWLHWYKNKV